LHRYGPKAKLPITKGIPEENKPTAMAVFELLVNPLRSTSRPTTNMKIIRPNWAQTLKNILRSAGNNFFGISPGI
jgi:hypothetical protein